ncbi:unnamed protein product [Ceratitis capitata]|uniref:(Mediterranean fruit fly) hypothetical protein n=1 Tax=Ceratitis capitata TaxID=7213 RepID=A0A811UU36_CERCA|nr:unnamed protein product [Ceratitis capitata]
MACLQKFEFFRNKLRITQKENITALHKFVFESDGDRQIGIDYVKSGDLHLTSMTTSATFLCAGAEGDENNDDDDENEGILTIIMMKKLWLALTKLLQLTYILSIHNKRMHETARMIE